MEWMPLTAGLLFGILGVFVIPLLYHKRLCYAHRCREQRHIVVGSLRAVHQTRLSNWFKRLKHCSGSAWYVSYAYEINQEGYIWSGVLYHEPLKSALIYYRPDDIAHAKLDAELEIPLWIQLFWPLAAVLLTLILTVFCVRMG